MLYDYECNSCGHAQERFFDVNQRKRWVRCPVCGRRANRVWVSAPAGYVFGGGAAYDNIAGGVGGRPFVPGSRVELIDHCKRTAETEDTHIEVPYHDIEVGRKIEKEPEYKPKFHHTARELESGPVEFRD